MAVFACGPFEFTDFNGRQISVPLSALKFNAGNLEVDGTIWRGESAPSFVSALLASLKEQGIVIQPAAASPKSAMVFTAREAGASGNNITVAITVAPSADLDPSKAKISVTVTETDVYPGLTMATIEGIMGSETTTAAHPGLAHIVHATLDATKFPIAQSLAFPTVPAGTKSKVVIVDSGPATVFSLEAKKDGPDAQFTTADISALDTVAKTFTLTLTWTHSVNNSTLPSLEADFKALGYEVGVTPPTSGIFSVPVATAAGSPIALTGGSASASASATIFASE
jgi:hypothetical protein